MIPVPILATFRPNERGRLLVADPAAGGTGLILFPRTDALPAAWVGPVPDRARSGRCRGAAGRGPAVPPAAPARRRLVRAAGPVRPPARRPAGLPAAAGRDWSPLFRPGRIRARRPPGPGRGRGQGRRAAAGDRDRGGAGRRDPGPAHADQPRPPARTWSTAWKWSSRCRAGSARSSTSPGGRPPSASRSATGSATGCGCAKAAAATPATTRPPCWSPGRPASPSAAAKPTACTSPGAATPCTGSSAVRRAPAPTDRRRRAAAARRDRAGRGRVLRHPVGLPRRRRSGLDDLSAQFHGYLRVAARAPALAPPGQPQRVGGGLLPTTTWTS